MWAHSVIVCAKSHSTFIGATVGSHGFVARLPYRSHHGRGGGWSQAVGRTDCLRDDVPGAQEVCPPRSRREEYTVTEQRTGRDHQWIYHRVSQKNGRLNDRKHNFKTKTALTLIYHKLKKTFRYKLLGCITFKGIIFCHGFGAHFWDKSVDQVL